MTILTTTTTTTIFTFYSIIRVKYIKALIFNQISVISNRLNKDDSRRQRRSLIGRDIIKLPHLEMITIYAMPWSFICHYLPDDCNTILLERRRLVISQYCCHQNATLDTLVHLLEWSTADVGFDWNYLKENSKNIFNQEILEYLIDRCPDEEKEKNNFLIEAMRVACTYGHLSTVKLIDSIKGVEHHNIMDIASSNGFIDIVKYLHGNNSITKGCSKDAMDKASYNNHLEVVKFLHFNRSEGATTKAMDMAAGKGHIDVVQYLSEHRSEGATNMAIDLAAVFGHTEIVNSRCAKLVCLKKDNLYPSFRGYICRSGNGMRNTMQSGTANDTKDMETNNSVVINYASIP
ncbi:hypothetical protein DFA_04415 [Cavenderia fasciculata]|uniref:Ankyrin repeat-containing protein n=1 Tax=Cavenderia fasciculata TaxID=261658 RepID=F4PPI4_CACFS|nr:uncharacterized protein DFA_04415 [Cavenderia fasciculata]EGG22297.1 hypothetical protein DFA_04415 [Cavenderia fasciculata]|eukprot:XP_004360148.1 hypothetical protein DFA_04415 [Cavenderia fasciculata]